MEEIVYHHNKKNRSCFKLGICQKQAFGLLFDWVYATRLFSKSMLHFSFFCGDVSTSNDEIGWNSIICG
jgi:hypothetical protein